MDQSPPAAGWYADPWDQSQQRYWDGQQWTGHTHNPQPQSAPAGQLDYIGSAGAGGYSDYQQVPFFRRQWFFWLTYVLFAPIALGILISGDVYYRKRGQIKSFGPANRAVAGILALFWIGRIGLLLTS